MLQKKIDDLFNSIPNVFGNADILIAGFDVNEMDNDARLEQVLQRWGRLN